MSSTAAPTPTPAAPTPAPDEVAARAAALADELGEAEPSVRASLRRLVRRVEWPLCEEVLEETRAIEADGGLWSVQDKKRRTKGGVFLALIKDRSAAARAVMYLQQAQRDQQARKKIPPFQWEQRGELVRETLEHRGLAMTAKLMLMGRPEKVVQHQDFVVTSLDYHGAPSLPKGLPVPKSSRTTYTVYIVAKQWRKVAEALQDPEDQLIVEGYCMLDPESGCITVLAQSATTRALQRQKLAGGSKASAKRAAAAAPPAEPAAPPPPPPPPPAPSAEELVRALLQQLVAGGQTLQALADRSGLPLRRLQDVHDGRPTTLTPAQMQTVLQKVRQAAK